MPLTLSLKEPFDFVDGYLAGISATKHVVDVCSGLAVAINRVGSQLTRVSTSLDPRPSTVEKHFDGYGNRLSS